jgi:Protein of unknown function (DUF1553)/Protein of unknown function (DUF1549)/Planctomycete cytochrome C/Concanavalin A-like lectin/glucanases superfamily
MANPRGLFINIRGCLTSNKRRHGARSKRLWLLGFTSTDMHGHVHLCGSMKPVITRVYRVLVLLLVAIASTVVSHAAVPLSYNFDVRPVLASKCFACHGMDAAKRKGKLRLDDRAAALEKKAIVPGDPLSSELIKRITSTDQDEVMPPPEKHNALSVAEKELLQKWIAEGAKYEQHWSFTTPNKPEVPVLPGVGSPIDALVRDQLAKKGWQPAAEANRLDWIRRVSFALTGLPPTLKEIDDFIADTSLSAHAAVVDRLLKSPHFGERMAAVWCDAARYADTYGRHEDADSMVWPWRDWVIKAFNENLPYDQFIHWQMAGDLLPHATQEQIIATVFHRLAVQSNESGSDPEEFRWDQVFDRVKTTATAVLGMTMECARCHDHKYDPLTRGDYYRFAAFFDKSDELGLFSRYTNGIPSPTTWVYKPGQQAEHAQLKKSVQVAEEAYKVARASVRPRFDKWLQDHAPPTRGEGLWGELGTPGNSRRMEAPFTRPQLYTSFDLIDVKKRVFIVDSKHDMLCSGSISLKDEAPGKVGRGCYFNSDHSRKIGFPPRVANFHRWQPFTFSLWLQMDTLPQHGVILHRSRAGLDAANRGYELTFEDGKLTATLAYFYPGNAIRVQAEERIEFSEFHHVAFTYDGSSRADGIQLFVDGRRIKTRIVRDNLYNDIDYRTDWGDLDSSKVADADLGNAITLKLGGRTLDTGLRDATLDELRVYNVSLSSSEIAVLAGISNDTDDTAWISWFAREEDGPCRVAFNDLVSARKFENNFAAQLMEIMVMAEPKMAKRETHMLNRGDFRQPGDIVEPSTPASLLPYPADAPKNRQGLAQWLTDPRHPLTSRVQVNRLWTMFFGRGLVATPEDFGLQGRVPAEPALLDWLAVHFIESGWDMKALCREIALSQTYRQSSAPANEAIRKDDPDNQFLARGPRFRLPAEQLRDAALSACGLLRQDIGGPSVMPYQPVGLWEDNGTQHVYTQDKGDKLYRRSLYTFWRRTCPPPVMSVFDAPTREFCRVKRESTLTPLQALAMLNDTGFIEAARVLSERLVREHPGTTQDANRVTTAFRLLIGRPPSGVQLKSMNELIAEARNYYTAQPAEAEKLIKSAGEAATDKALQPIEIASTLLMTRALINSEPFIVSY